MYEQFGLKTVQISGFPIPGTENGLHRRADPGELLHWWLLPPANAVHLHTDAVCCVTLLTKQ